MATSNNINSSSTVLAMTNSGVVNRTIAGTANQISVSNGDGISGNPTLALTSTIQVSGISFDSGSNTLSAYSTGTFTPTITGSSSNPTVTYVANGQVGTYTKIGSKVFTSFYVAISLTIGGSGDLRISGLPFTSLSTTNSDSSGPLIAGSVNLTSINYLQTSMVPNVTYANILASTTGSAIANFQIGVITSSTVLEGSLCYNI